MSTGAESMEKLYGTDHDPAVMRRAFTAGEVPVAVYGLGKMGLPLAAVYADVTGNTTGVDVDESVVASVRAGECHVEREPGLPELVSSVVDRGALTASTDGLAVAEGAAVHVVMVPTLLTEDHDPDLSTLEAVVETVGRGLDPGDLVIVESTVPPRTCTDLVVPRLAAESGLEPGDFGVACCPERTVSGQAVADVRGTHPKVVGGVDDESARTARAIYEAITDNEVVVTPDARTAAAVKVFEGVYRDVNIALANQLARYARAVDLDVEAAIEVANTQPFCEIHDPGPGVGGHCIPVYPYFLVNAFDVDDRLLPVARAVNDGMPEYAVDVARSVLEAEGVAPSDATVLLCGLTYKANIAELRNAPSIPLARGIRDLGARVLGADPLLDDWSRFEGVEPVPVDVVESADPDLAILVTPHDEFRDFDWDALGAPVLDGRGAVDAAATDVPVYSIGGRRK